jgi:uncharacterized protein (TIGR03435 family)
MTAGSIAAALERFSDRPVVDMTGLAGTYDFVFEVKPEETGGDPLPGAVEQLGLKFDARNALRDVVIVDDVRRVPVEN